MHRSLEAASVVVVGGSSGIGLACVRQALAEGARVHVGSRSEARWRAADGDGALGAAQWSAVDVQDPASLERLCAAAAPIDLLLLVATGTERAMGPFMDMDPEGFRRSFGKLWGYCNSVRAGVPHMAAQGAIVMVGGAVARKCPPGMIAVSSVGNAIEGFCRALAVEIAPIRVNVVAPGLIDTPMFAHVPEAQREAMFATRASTLPLGRVGRPEEVADAILAVATNGYMTGTTVDVDGGSLLP
ncbi:MAG: SDR family oxidoreductase [Pseudomonadales bacterium]|jgi:NAD(P)-dependent dehydrogenase (short-subunit alcohol dehydrogenase family)|nr:SDR family oxidoreductase [Pseudomonadales bacterium]